MGFRWDLLKKRGIINAARVLIYGREKEKADALHAAESLAKGE